MSSPNLSYDDKFEALGVPYLVDHAVAKWEEYCAKRSISTYAETVGGTQRTFDTNLSAETQEAVHIGQPYANGPRRPQKRLG